MYRIIYKHLNPENPKEKHEKLAENKLLSIHIKIDSNGDTINHNIQKNKHEILGDKETSDKEICI